jgi:hypothetical protein
MDMMDKSNKLSWGIFYHLIRWLSLLIFGAIVLRTVLKSLKSSHNL